MDVQSPAHLERFRDSNAIKAVLLRERASADATTARFVRSEKNVAYWPPIEELDATMLGTGVAAQIVDTRTIYGQRCWLLATSLDQRPDAPYAIAVADANGASAGALIALMNDVNRDYWHGSSFFK